MSYEADAPWRLTSRAQAMLGVSVDGVWGPETAAAYRYADANLRGRIDAILARERLSAYSVQRVTTSVSRPAPNRSSGPINSVKRYGSPRPASPAKVAAKTPNPVAPAAKTGTVATVKRYGSPRLASPTKVAAKTPTKVAAKIPNPAAPAAKTGTVANRLVGWYTEEQLAPVLRAAVAGLQYATYDQMVRKLKLEAGQTRVGGTTYYNARSVNGQYRGLFQMGQAAWTDVQSRLGHTYDSVFDPAINARAAALYIENNVRVARKLGYTGAITSDVLYAMHNQGVAGFLRVASGGKVEGNQSKAARRVIANATGQA